MRMDVMERRFRRDLAAYEQGASDSAGRRGGVGGPIHRAQHGRRREHAVERAIRNWAGVSPEFGSGSREQKRQAEGAYEVGPQLRSYLAWAIHGRKPQR